jgi:hypothetical protein
MLTSSGVGRVRQREAAVRDFVDRLGRAGRTENRRERGGLGSAASRRLEQLRETAAARKHRSGERDEITVYDFLAFFNINQYMPLQKYRANRQAVENLVRDDEALLAITGYLDERFGETYKSELQRGSKHGTA